MTTTRSRIGSNVRAARLARGLTQAALAELVDKSVETISNVERGNISPSIDTLISFAGALQVEPAALLAGIGPAPSGGTAHTPAPPTVPDEFVAIVATLDDSAASHLLALAKLLAIRPSRRGRD